MERPARHSAFPLRDAFIFALCLTALTGCAKRYRVEGMVVSIQSDPPAMSVAHRSVPGLMPAMTMPFRLENEQQLRGLTPGTRLSFDLHLHKGRSKVRDIRVWSVRQQDEDVLIPVAEEKLSIGQTVPDFELTDQSGRPWRLSDLRGRVAVVNFLYTRCPLPDVCPRLAAGFASIQRKFAERIPASLMLVSITLDPRYDTPDVLSRYSASVGARSPGWRFLTGTDQQVTEVARRFGLLHWAEEGLIVHSSYTAVIGRDGRLAALVEGSSFPLEQLASLLQHILDARE
jgi:protein SCO1/2